MNDWFDKKDITNNVIAFAITATLAAIAAAAAKPVRALATVPVPAWTLVAVAVFFVSPLVLSIRRRRSLRVSIAGLEHSLDQQRQATEYQNRVAKTAEEALEPLRSRADQLAAKLDDCQTSRDLLSEQVKDLQRQLREERVDPDPPRPPIR